MSNERIIPTMGRNNCGGRCRILVHKKDGKIISIKGEKKRSYMSREAASFQHYPGDLKHGNKFYGKEDLKGLRLYL